MTELPRVSARWLSRGAVPRILALLNADGEEARVVGGAVRNAVLGEKVGDIDIATTAPPQVVAARTEAAGLKVVPTGIDHGTVTLIVAGRGYEVTTLRRDVETDGRRARVVFGRDWGEDAARRDFTMNALYLRADGRLEDPLGGFADLVHRRVRFIGDAHERIREDGLRILRFFRFTAAYGVGQLDAAGLSACIAERAFLDRLSRERIRQETMKLLVADHVQPVVEAMAEAGLAQRILGGIAYAGPFARLLAIEVKLGVPADAIRRLAVLATAVAEDAERLDERLRLTVAERKRLRLLAPRRPDISPALGEAGARVLLYREGADAYRDLVPATWARAGAAADDQAWADLAGVPDRWAAPAMPFKGADLIALGVPSGRAVGLALRRFEDWWISEGFPQDTETQRRGLASAMQAGADRAGEGWPVGSPD